MQIHLETCQDRARTSARAARQNVDLIKIHFFWILERILCIAARGSEMRANEFSWSFRSFWTQWSSSDSILNANGKKQLFFTVTAHFWLHPLNVLPKAYCKIIIFSSD